MKFLGLLLALALFIPGGARAEPSWDDLDVVDGPNPTLRYGFYTQPSGQVNMGRYYFIDDGETLRVRLAEYGKRAVELPVRSYDRDRGVLNLGWEGLPARSCQLERHNDQLFLGNCLEASAVMPMAIRVANEYDREWMGTHLPASEVDLAIIARARELLESQPERNLAGDRICADDMATNRFSVFCALYASAIEVDGVYRHRRPAMRATRAALMKAYPGEYVHTLRDINNNPSIPDAALLAALDQAHALLKATLGTPWHK